MKTIKYSNMPVRAPVVHTIAWYLLLDKFQVGSFGMGVFWTVAAIVWVLSLTVMFHQKQVDIFEEFR